MWTPEINWVHQQTSCPLYQVQQQINGFLSIFGKDCSFGFTFKQPYPFQLCLKINFGLTFCVPPCKNFLYRLLRSKDCTTLSLEVRKVEVPLARSGLSSLQNDEFSIVPRSSSPLYMLKGLKFKRAKVRYFLCSQIINRLWHFYCKDHVPWCHTRKLIIARQGKNSFLHFYISKYFFHRLFQKLQKIAFPGRTLVLCFPATATVTDLKFLRCTLTAALLQVSFSGRSSLLRSNWIYWPYRTLCSSMLIKTKS